MPIVAIETVGILFGTHADGKGFKENNGSTSVDFVSALSGVERIVVQNGAVPALIAVIDGKICVGLDESEKKKLCDDYDSLVKISRKDLPVVVALGGSGVLTVSAAMMVARMSKIPILVTAGVGGVHKGADKSMDISADLEELVQSQVVVVATGVNPHIDVGLTVEYLETHGVPLIGYKTDHFGMAQYRVDTAVEAPQDIAKMLSVKRSLDISGSILVINPVTAGEDDPYFKNSPISTQDIITHYKENLSLGAWISSALALDLPISSAAKAKAKPKEKSMSFELWLFAVKGFAQQFDAAQLIYNNLPESEKVRLHEEYDRTVE